MTLLLLQDTSGMEQPDSQQHQAGAARSSRQGDPQASSRTESGPEQQQQKRLDESNPYRSLGAPSCPCLLLEQK